MPKINEILLKLEGFQYARSLDLNLGYYHIQLSENASDYIQLFFHGGNIITSVYQWELLTHKTFSIRK